MTDNQMEKAPATAALENNPGWEREVLEKLAFAAVTEQRRARRWSIFFKTLMITYVIVLTLIAFYPQISMEIGGDSKQHTAVINIIGMISEDKQASAKTIIEGLRDAVKDKNTKGIILHFNTPGGTPVQAAYVYEEIRRIKKQNPELPIIAVISDMCTSGGYYIASAADKIYANQASIVGSIGVIMNGFGFVDTLKKFGVERRLLTAGAHKAMLDPFSPENTMEMQHMQGLLEQVHQQFIGAVRDGRGSRLQETPEIFSGLVWTGAESVKLGLIDGFGNDDFVARNVIGVKKQKNFTQQERLLDRIAGKLGAEFAHMFGLATQNFMLH